VAVADNAAPGADAAVDQGGVSRGGTVGWDEVPPAAHSRVAQSHVALVGLRPSLRGSVKLALFDVLRHRSRNHRSPLAPFRD
jgi:hypothetical protein